MIALILSILSLLCVFIVIPPLRARNYHIKFNITLILISFIIVLLGIFILITQNRILVQAFEKRNWPTTIGEIVRTEVAGKRAYHPQVYYKYQIENRTYSASTDLHISGFGNKRSRLDNSQRIINEFPPGARVKVFYDPRNPETSYLRVGPFWSDYMKLAIGVLFFATGAFVLTANLYDKIKD